MGVGVWIEPEEAKIFRAGADGLLRGVANL
jgi:hypothetical protein